MTTTVDPSMVTGNAAIVQQLADLRSIFVGKPFVLPYPPSPTSEPWFVLCYGQLLTISTYPLLFSRFGTRYGGNGSTTFGVPDYRGRTIVGLDNMGNVGAGRITGFAGLGAAGGVENVTLSVPQMPQHYHVGTTGPGTPHQHNFASANVSSSGNASTYAIVNGPNTFQTTFEDQHTHDFATNPVGGNAAHTNVQPSILQYICVLAY